jgi:hypothetical protein
MTRSDAKTAAVDVDAESSTAGAGPSVGMYTLKPIKKYFGRYFTLKWLQKSGKFVLIWVSNEPK